MWFIWRYIAPEIKHKWTRKRSETEIKNKTWIEEFKMMNVYKPTQIFIVFSIRFKLICILKKRERERESRRSREKLCIWMLNMYILLAESKWHIHVVFNSIQFGVAVQQYPGAYNKHSKIWVTMQMAFPFVALYYHSVDDDGDTEELITIANWIEANKFSV